MSQTSVVAPASEPSSSSGCPSCGSTEPWGFASWCPNCGYYPALKMTVGGGSGQAAPTGAAASNEANEITDWRDLFPRWSLIMGAGVVLIIVGSFIPRLAIDPESDGRFLWAMGQIGLGAALFFSAHLMSYLFAAAKTDSIGPFDAFLRPLAVWQPTFKLLPQTATRVRLAAWGLAAILAALTVVDGIPWASFFEGTAKKKPNTMKKVVAMARNGAKNGNGSESLEESMKEFTGTAEEDKAKSADGSDDGEGEGNKKDEKDKDADKGEKSKDDKKKGEEKKEDEKKGDQEAKIDDEQAPKGESIECVIFGYMPDRSNGIGVLLLAAPVDGQLRFVCTITAESVPDQLRSELTAKLKKLPRDKPFVKTSLTAKWVQPVVICKIQHDGWTRDKKLKQAEFVELSPDARTGKSAPHG